MTTEMQLLTVLIILALFVANAIVRPQRVPLRPIRALDRLPSLAEESLESSRPLHLSLGGATLGGQDTLLTLVSAEVLYQTAKQVALGDAPPIVTFSQPATVPIGWDILRRAFSGRNTFVRPLNVRWLPEGQSRMGFVAGVNALQRDDSLSANVLVGTYGAELALVLWASERANKPHIAHSTHLSGQAVAYGMAQETLLGEEIFAGGAYLSQDVGLLQRVRVLDVVRFVTALALLVVFVVTLSRGI